MNLLNIISGPLIGGIVGYITNYLAIKMLFRPTTPVMIGKFRVPFTPGIVPRHKNRLAFILGDAVVARFFNSDDLEIVFMSEYFQNAVADSIVEVLYNENASLGSMLSNLNLQSHSGQLLNKTKDELCIRIQAAILKSDLPRLIAEEGGRVVKKRIGSSAVGKLLNEEMIAAISKPLAEQIEKFVINDGRSIILPLLNNDLDELADQPVANIMNAVMPDKSSLHQIVCSIYIQFMRNHVRSIAESVDIKSQITEKVLLMDPAEIETLVLSVVNRELYYVVLLGFLLGVLIGTINIFI